MEIDGFGVGVKILVFEYVKWYCMDFLIDFIELLNLRR